MRNSINRIRIKLMSTGFFHVFISTFLNKGITFLAGIVLVRLLSKEAYGTFSYAYNIYSFFMLATGMGMGSAILQVCSEEINVEKKDQLYQYGCTFGIIFDVFLACIMLIVALMIPLPISGANLLLATMALLPLVQLVPSLQMTFLRTELRNKEYAKSTNLQTVFIAGLTMLLCVFFKEYGRILALYIASIITMFFIRYIYGVNVSVRKPNLEKKYQNDMIRIAVISMLNTGLSELMYLIDIYVLGFTLADEQAIAIYKVSTIIPTALSFIPLAVVTYAYPYFAKNRENKKWMKKISICSYVSLGLLNLIIGILLVFLAPYILTVVYGKEYLDAVNCFRILGLNYTISGTFRVFSGNILVSQRKLMFNFVVALMSSIINIVLNILFISLWGIEGAAIATLITSTITGILNTGYLCIVISRI